MSTVSLVRFGGSSADVDRALGLVGAADIVRPGARVLVKPNLHGGPGYTSPRVVEAVCRWAAERGAAEVFVGDGPFWACPADQAREYFRQAGLYAVAEAAGARAVNLHELPYRRLQTDDPALPEEIGLTELLFECDAVINLPLLKTHLNTLVTLGIKNLKGCLRPKDKKRFHELELNAALVGLTRIAAPRLSVTLLDATIAVEGMGPAAGTEVEMGLLAASRDLVAVDSVGCSLAGIDPGEVRAIRDCARLGLGELDLDRITVVGEDPARHRRRFKRPHEQVAEHFPDLEIVTDGACSACAMNLFEALAAIHHEGRRLRVPAVAIGGKGRIWAGLTVGNCAEHAAEAAEYLPGCPPSAAQIREALTRGG
ncbi:MAG: DUF362 domain-containing protein [Armatimonadetes bacterium]|nr:DUF362 domain-containing protein [Armatimonadota bacterium]